MPMDSQGVKGAATFQSELQPLVARCSRHGTCVGEKSRRGYTKGIRNQETRRTKANSSQVPQRNTRGSGGITEKVGVAVRVRVEAGASAWRG